MSEAKRAAVVKRGGERDHADLFASRPADLGSVKQTLRPPAPEGGGVAARNETSVLFTIDALKATARVKTPEPELAPLSSAFVGGDDEGVIDLKALASTPPRVGSRSVAPLFSDAPPAAFAADVNAPGGSDMMTSGAGGFKLGKRALAGIAAAAVAVVLCSVGLAAAFKGEEPVVRTTNAAMAPVLPTAPVVAAPAAPAPVIAPVVASNDSSSSSDDDANASTPAKGKKGKKGKGKGKASLSKVQSSGIASSKSEALVSKPAPKAADKCGCKGDFNCILRCTAKGS